MLIPQFLVSDLLESLYGKANKHLAISKMLEEIRCEYCYTSITKIASKWAQGCEAWIEDKGISNTSISPDLFILPEWDLEAEDATQKDLLPSSPQVEEMNELSPLWMFFEDNFCLPSH